MSELKTVVTAAADGVMTDEVGVITGDVEITSAFADGTATAKVRYDGAIDVYTITDAAKSLASADELATYHEELVGKYRA